MGPGVYRGARDGPVDGRIARAGRAPPRGRGLPRARPGRRPRRRRRPDGPLEGRPAMATPPGRDHRSPRRTTRFTDRRGRGRPSPRPGPRRSRGTRSPPTRPATRASRRARGRHRRALGAGSGRRRPRSRRSARGPMRVDRLGRRPPRRGAPRSPGRLDRRPPRAPARASARVAIPPDGLDPQPESRHGADDVEVRGTTRRTQGRGRPRAPSARPPSAYACAAASGSPPNAVDRTWTVRACGWRAARPPRRSPGCTSKGIGGTIPAAARAEPSALAILARWISPSSPCTRCSSPANAWSCGCSRSGTWR